MAWMAMTKKQRRRASPPSIAWISCMVRAVSRALEPAQREVLLSALAGINEFMRQKVEEYDGARRENA